MHYTFHLENGIYSEGKWLTNLKDKKTLIDQQEYGQMTKYQIKIEEDNIR